MKEQWKKLDNDAKLLVNVEEGRALPIKIELPLSALAPRDDGCCRSLLVTLRVITLLSLLVLISWTAALMYTSHYNTRPIDFNEDSSLISSQANKLAFRGRVYNGDRQTNDIDEVDKPLNDNLVTERSTLNDIHLEQTNVKDEPKEEVPKHLIFLDSAIDRFDQVAQNVRNFNQKVDDISEKSKRMFSQDNEATNNMSPQLGDVDQNIEDQSMTLLEFLQAIMPVGKSEFINVADSDEAPGVFIQVEIQEEPVDDNQNMFEVMKTEDEPTEAEKIFDEAAITNDIITSFFNDLAKSLDEAEELEQFTPDESQVMEEEPSPVEGFNLGVIGFQQPQEETASPAVEEYNENNNNDATNWEDYERQVRAELAHIDSLEKHDEDVISQDQVVLDAVTGMIQELAKSLTELENKSNDDQESLGDIVDSEEKQMTPDNGMYQGYEASETTAGSIGDIVDSEEKKGFVPTECSDESSIVAGPGTKAEKMENFVFPLLAKSLEDIVGKNHELLIWYNEHKSEALNGDQKFLIAKTLYDPDTKDFERDVNALLVMFTFERTEVEVPAAVERTDVQKDIMKRLTMKSYLSNLICNKVFQPETLAEIIEQENLKDLKVVDSNVSQEKDEVDDLNEEVIASTSPLVAHSTDEQQHEDAAEKVDESQQVNDEEDTNDDNDEETLAEESSEFISNGGFHLEPREAENSPLREVQFGQGNVQIPADLKLSDIPESIHNLNEEPRNYATGGSLDEMIAKLYPGLPPLEDAESHQFQRSYVAEEEPERVTADLAADFSEEGRQLDEYLAMIGGDEYDY